MTGLTEDERRDLDQLEVPPPSGRWSASDVARLRRYWFSGTAADRQRIDRLMDRIRKTQAKGTS